MKNKLTITEAIQSIVDKNNLISAGAKSALESEEKLIGFSNEIFEQCAEEGTNQNRLENIFGEDVIKTILEFIKRKAVEHDFIVMNGCIKEDIDAIESAKKMNLHLLITNTMEMKRPSSVKEIVEWGQCQIVVGDNIMDTRTGLHCVVEDTLDNFLNWFSQLDEVIIGSGSPQLENFTIYDYSKVEEEGRKELVLSNKMKW